MHFFADTGHELNSILGKFKDYYDFDKKIFNFHRNECRFMLPADFYDVTYDQIWSKILQEIIKSKARNTGAHFEH